MTEIFKEFNIFENASLPLLVITGLGIMTRLVYWVIYPLNWKLHAAFNVFELGFVPYLSNFSGYKPGRMPFFDALSAAFYVPFAPLFGAEALVVFNLCVTFAAIPAFYVAVRRLFSQNVAIPAGLLFALYPKYIVLTSTGLPEAASISFLVLALYTFTSGRDSGHLIQYFAAGVLATLAYLMFVPAVAAGVLLALFIYFSAFQSQHSSETLVRRLLPNRKLVSFSVVPGVVGMLYLLFGPVSRVAGGLSEGKLSVFSNPDAYSFVEKVFWYNAHSFFDFWWHTRGFDRERGIEALINSLQGFFGSFFPVYFVGWAVITLMLTGLIFVGISVFIRRRRAFDLLFIAWILVYIAAYNYKNLGWLGGFQTRHVFPIFPILCIAFGVGVYNVQKAHQKVDLSLAKWTRTMTVVSVIIVISLSILFVNGAAQGTIENQKIEQDTVEPAAEINKIVGDDSVAVVWPRNQRNIVLYSENKLRPVILAGSDEQMAALEARHGKTSTRQLVSDPLLCDAGTDYLYLHVEREIIDRFPYSVGLNESQVGQLVNTHEVIYQKKISQSSFRTTNVEIYLLRLWCTNTGE